MDAPPAARSTLNATLYLLWVETWNKAVARAWRDEAFAEALCKNPKHTIAEAFGFVFHDSIDLSVTRTPTNAGYGWQPDKADNGVWNLPATQVNLFLPPAPEAKDQAVAVMAYWESDAALPFSCSCA